MIKSDYEAVIRTNRTTSGYLFGLPIVMDSDRDDISVGDKVLLTYKNQNLAVMIVEEKWEPDKVNEAKGCYGTTSIEHPAVRMIATERKRFYLGGKVQGLELPNRIFPCKTPQEVRRFGSERVSGSTRTRLAGICPASSGLVGFHSSR